MTGARLVVRVLVALSAAISLTSYASGVATASAKSTIVVPRDFPTVQAAVNAATPGSTILVRAGTFAEQVVIDKDLTIRGVDSAGTIISSPAALTPHGVDAVTGLAQTAIVRVGNGARVRLSDLTVSGPAPCGQVTGIIALQGATLEISDAHVHDIEPGAVSCPAQPRGVGVAFGASPRIQVDGHSGSAASGGVTRVAIDTVLNEGLVATAPYDLSPSRVRFAHDIIRLGSPPFPVAQNAIDVFLNAVADVSHNTIDGASCTAPGCGPDPLNDLQAIGIFVGPGGAGSTFSHNVISHSEVGVYQYGSPNCCGISHDTLHDNRYFGILIQDGDGTTDKNTINGGQIGIGVVAGATDTTGVLRGDHISGTTVARVREIACCGFTATAIVKRG
jgi:hypothetical protein